MPNRRLKYLDRTCLVILVVIAVGGTAWNLFAIVSQERGLRQKTELRTQTASKLVQADRARKTLQQALGRVDQELADRKKRIPPQTDLGALLMKLNLRIRERRLTMTTIQPGTAVRDELYLKTPIRLIFQGPFMQSYLFLHDLENMDPLLVQEKVTITGLEPPQECQVDLTILVFERRTAAAGG